MSIATVKMFFMGPLQEYVNLNHSHFTKPDFTTLFGNLLDILAIATALQQDIRSEIARYPDAAEAMIGKVQFSFFFSFFLSCSDEKNRL